MLVVGSSRITTDFRPKSLPPLRTADGACPLPFNHSHSGAGPLFNLVQATRLANEGIKPRWMVIEVMPALLGVDGQSTAADLAEASDLPVLRKHIVPWKLYGRFVWKRASVMIDHRNACVHACLPWLDPAPFNCLTLEPLGDMIGAPERPADQEEKDRRMEAVRRQYFSGLQHLIVRANQDRAMRDLLTRCRAESIAVALLIAPESREFRSWYAAESSKKLENHCDALRHDFGVPIVDARDWMPDEDFADPHHLAPQGADRFTARLGREVLQPLAAGSADASFVAGSR